MNKEITWSREEISEYYKKALHCKATHIVVTWDKMRQMQELYYVVPPKSVENVISELENQAYNIVRIVTIKITLDATIKLNYLCLGERPKQNWKHRFFRYVECQECGAEVFREPVYSYVVGRPFIKCSSCGNFVQNEKRQEWVWMSAGEKLRAFGAGLIVTITNTVGVALLLGLLPIILNLFIPFYAEPWIQGMMIIGGTGAFIATSYCRFGVILPSLRRTRDKKYWESYRNHIRGFTQIREEEKPKKEQAVNVSDWSEFGNRESCIDLCVCKEKIEVDYIRNLLSMDEQIPLENPEFLFCIGLLYLEEESHWKPKKKENRQRLSGSEYQ